MGCTSLCVVTGRNPFDAAYFTTVQVRSERLGRLEPEKKPRLRKKSIVKRLLDNKPRDTFCISAKAESFDC